MTMFINKVSQLIGVLLIVTLTLSSCVQDADIEIDDPEIKSTFDSELTEVLNIMESEPERSIQQLDLIIEKAEAIDSKYYSGKSKWYKAYIYDDILEDVSKAYHHYNEALKDILQTDDSSMKMSLYNNLGILYRYYGQYDAAIANYESAIKLEKYLTTQQLSDVYYNYGAALKLKGDSISFFKAEQALTQSLKYAQKIDYYDNIARVHNHIGLIYKDQEDYSVARMAYNNTISKYANNKDLKDHVGKAYHGIGVTFMDEGNNDAAIRAFERALEFKQNSGSIFITKYDLGTALMNGGLIDQAIDVWEDALNEKHNKNSIEQVTVYADLTSALKMRGKYKQALGYSETYNSSIQNILSEGEKYKTKNAQVLFADIIKEYEEFNKPVPLFSRPLVIVSMAIAIVTTVYLLLFFYYRSKSRRRISQAVSEIQNEFLHLKVD